MQYPVAGFTLFCLQQCSNKGREDMDVNNAKFKILKYYKLALKKMFYE